MLSSENLRNRYSELLWIHRYFKKRSIENYLKAFFKDFQMFKN